MPFDGSTYLPTVFAASARSSVWQQLVLAEQTPPHTLVARRGLMAGTSVSAPDTAQHLVHVLTAPSPGRFVTCLAGHSATHQVLVGVRVGWSLTPAASASPKSASMWIGSLPARWSRLAATPAR